ncbi:MAG TPA: replicative DNA helicase [Anaerolineae bacterium]|mgnify:CR=1 FL=1|nr:replicative DNA helicase [Anaerolineae bacterium]HQI83039.1 replicative DNA helicase [Anaerolineae bacterium]
MTVPDKTVPHNIEAEEAVLGALLIDPEGIFRVLPFLRADDFYLQKHRWIYEAIIRIHDRRDPIDFLTLTTDLEQREQLEAVGGAVYISQLINAVPSAISIESYGRLVEQTAVRRRLLDAVSDIARLAYDEKLPIEQVVDKSEQALFGVSQQRATRDLQPIQEVVQRYYDRVEYLYAHRGEPMGVPTGFRDLDRILGGFQRSDLLILAARPGVGKTSLMLTFALKAAEKGRTVAVFSLEMSAEQLAQRMVAAISQIDAQRLRLGQLQDDEWPHFADAIGHLSDLPIYIDDTPSISVLQLRTKCRRLASERPLEMVFIDYLQLMNSDIASDNRVQEVSYISRSLKGIARELDIPLMTASQLSRAVEQRADKRPVLSDLRESGCLTGETLVQLADGRRVPICNLAQENHLPEVIALNEETGCLEPTQVQRAWHTGVKPVFRLVTQSGRQIRASANHQFLTIEGWKQLDTLKPGEHIALPRTLHCINVPDATLSETKAALLGHLLGDGCTLPHHAVQYTTNDIGLAEQVAELARSAFGEAIEPKISRERQWWQVYLSASEHLTHGKRNPVAEWLDTLDAWGYRSYEKRIPAVLFTQPENIIARFLRHLWATDGTMGVFGKKRQRAIATYATSSVGLAQDIQHLLLRLSITSRVQRVPQGQRGRDQWHVTITGKPDLMTFLGKVDVVSTKQSAAQAIRDFYQSKTHNTNRDVIPKEIWRSIVEPARQKANISQREFQAALNMQYCGTALYKSNLSRERALRVGQIVASEQLIRLAQNNIYWDKIASVEPDGEEDVYDLTVSEHHNFVAGDIIVHNSLEQDADIVMFIYREELYNEHTENPNIADIMIAKHRSGPTGTVQLYFNKRLTQFLDAATHISPDDYGRGQ